MARLLSFLPTSIATFIATRVIITEFGTDSFNSYTLAFSLIALLPFNNLGVNSAVAHAYASGRPGDPELERVVLSGTRVLTVSALLVAAGSFLLLLGDTWSRILGPSIGDETMFAALIAVYAFSFVPSLGDGVLLGLQKTDVSVALQANFAPVGLLGVAVVVALNGDSAWIIPVPAIAVLVVSMLVAGQASRLTSLSWSRIFGRLLRRKRYPGAKISHIAFPRLIAVVTTPLAVASDRLILSHTSEAIELTRYSLLAQLFGPIRALLIAASQPLWPMFVKARAEGRSGPPLRLVVGGFAAAGAAVSVVLVLVANPVGSVLSAGEVKLGYGLPLVASAALVMGTITYPLVSSFTTPRDLRFVAVLAVTAVPINIAISWILAQSMGASGPLLGTAISGFFAQAVPAMIYLRRRTPEQRGFQIVDEPIDAAATVTPVPFV